MLNRFIFWPHDDEPIKEIKDCDTYFWAGLIVICLFFVGLISWGSYEAGVERRELAKEESQMREAFANGTFLPPYMGIGSDAMQSEKWGWRE